MKNSVLIGIISLGIGVATSYGQGYIALDNYDGANTIPMTYGANVPANGVSGALGSGGLSSDFTVGFYWVGGNTGLSQAAGSDMPDVSLALAGGAGSTVRFATQNTAAPGFYASQPSWYAGSALTTITMEVVAYSGSSYASAAYRWRSAAFAMTTGAITTNPALMTGDSMPGAASFAVVPVAVIPEPATMALGGLGLASLLLFRRKQA
jgi:hypothetical protein